MSDAASVARALDALGRPVVLVGHSYGGVVVTEAGAHPSVVEVIYVAAFMLDEGETLASAAAAAVPDGAGDAGDRPDLVAALVINDDFTACTVDPVQAASIFYGDCPPDVAAAAVQQLGPHSTAVFEQSPTSVAWRERPSTYAMCSKDLAVRPELQATFARRATRCLTWPTSHSPFLSRPDLVTDLLVECVKRHSPTN